MMLSLDTAYRSFGGEVEGASTPTKCRLSDSHRHQLWAIARTRYWCLTHKADATAKYGRPAMACRAAHLPPILPHEILDLDLDQYPGGVGLWGAVPPVYDTTRLPLDFGI